LLTFVTLFPARVPYATKIQAGTWAVAASALALPRSTLPYTVLLAIAVLLISYVPDLTLWLVRWYDAAYGTGL
jgi:TRAP-type C4-dicarboxylate transport system permease large subunit